LASIRSLASPASTLKKTRADINDNMFSDTDETLIQDMIDVNDLVRPVNRIPRCEIVKGDILDTRARVRRNTAGSGGGDAYS